MAEQDYRGFYKEIAETIKKSRKEKGRKSQLTKDNLNKLKIKLSKKHHLKKIPTDIEIMLNIGSKDFSALKKFLQTKPVRTLSGVSIAAIMTKPLPCPHEKKGIGPCIQCPGGPKENVPQSYTGKEPATLRAIRAGYDPYLQIFNRLEQYIILGHNPEKVELIIMGGTFPSYSKSYQDNFIKFALKAMNDFSNLFYLKTKKGKEFKKEFNIEKFKKFFFLPGNIQDKNRTKNIQKKLIELKRKNKTTIEKEQLRNETSNIKCVGLTIETRPDYAMLKHANNMLRLGTTRVELGVQTVYNEILKKIKRGHTVEDSVKATQILKDLGFKINYHIMPGLPGSSYEKDLFALNVLFDVQEFQPDMLKIYPCMVLKGTKLYEMWKAKKFNPMTTQQASKLIAEFKTSCPEYVRIMRVQRDIPTYMTSAGVDRTNLRQTIEEIMKKKAVKCNCIRCREIKKSIPKKIVYETIHYPASGGNEFFIQAVTPDNKLVGFCRLRIPGEFLRKEITKSSALVRELHVYGPSLAIGKTKTKIKKSSNSKKAGICADKTSQHAGIGKELLKKAEETAKLYFRDKLVIISGIGVREYYRKLGYKKQGPYMVKSVA